MDEILKIFLEDGLRRSNELVSESDILRVVPHPLSSPPLIYLLIFEDMEFLRYNNSDIVNISRGVIPVEIRFPLDYLRSSDSSLYLKIATILDPSDILYPNAFFFHPNYDPVTGCICLGADFTPEPLDALIWHIYEIITYNNFGVDERNAMNPLACRYLRDHPDVVSSLRIRPLRRRKFNTTLLLREVREK